MEAVDNPSYFTVPGGSSSKVSLLKRRGLGVAPGLSTPPPVSPGRRPRSRALLRSVSAHGDPSLLVLGNPRLCDLAPAHRPSASATDLHLDDDDGEVFLYPDGDARYYNTRRRRHSFNEFVRRSSASSPQLASPPACHSSRKRCGKCTEKVSKGSELVDIVILSSKASEAASLWVSYLTTCFQQVAKERSRPPFKLLSVSVEEVLSGVSVLPQHDSILHARLQLVILCPVFLESLSAANTTSSSLSSLLQPGHVLAMLLGVTDDNVTVQHRTALLCYDQWQRQVVKDQDPMFVGDFLGTAMDILSRSYQLQAAISQAHRQDARAEFSVLPKKIKLGQNKLLVLLVDPLEATDEVHIRIDKSGQNIDINTFKKRNPYTLQFAVPACCMQVSMLVTVVVEKNGRPLGHRLIKCESRMRELDQLLRSTDSPLHFMCQTLGLSPGDREQLDVFLAAAFQQNLPPHFNLLRSHGLRYHGSCEEYPTLLHFAAKYGLEKLTWQLLECAGGEQASQIRNTCQLTPADLAERAGHSRLAHTLKGFLQMTELSSVYSYLKGMSDKQAKDLVTNFNSTNYLLPRPLNTTYSVPPTARPVLNTPPPPSHPLPPQYTNVDSYQVPPSPVSVHDSFLYNVPHPLDNYQVPGQAIPYNPPTPPTPSSPLGYMDMQSPGNCNGVGSANRLRRKMSLNLNVNLPQHEYLNCPSDHFQDHCLHGHTADNDNMLSCQSNNSSNTTADNQHRNSSHSSHSGKSSSVSGSAQDELVEIINDFKNNVFTIAEVEKLVESWQNRHDVQQSFKEKQKQLNEMREEYEKIQQAMKENMKRATPFERIRKFFSRGKNKGCTGDCKKKLVLSASSPTSTVSATAGHRPASSLSLQSSCSSTSSGRMSTGSGTSLGDSGTHSDMDERKGGRQDLRGRMLSGRHYVEISQNDIEEYEADKHRVSISDCGSSLSGHSRPSISYLHRSNSLQEHTIEEEVDECKMAQDRFGTMKSFSTINKEVTTVDIHYVEASSSHIAKEEIPKLPLPPGMKNEVTVVAQIEKVKIENTPEVHQELVIIEDGDKIQSNPDSSDCSTSNACCNGADLDQSSDDDSKGYVKALVSFIEGGKSCDAQEDVDDVCENILEEAETEVVFELPDYVNVTAPLMPSCTTCENVST